MRDFGERIQTVDFVTKRIALIMIVTLSFIVPSCLVHTASCIASSTIESGGKLGVSPTQSFTLALYCKVAFTFG